MLESTNAFSIPSSYNNGSQLTKMASSSIQNNKSSFGKDVFGGCLSVASWPFQSCISILFVSSKKILFDWHRDEHQTQDRT